MWKKYDKKNNIDELQNNVIQKISKLIFTRIKKNVII